MIFPATVDAATGKEIIHASCVEVNGAGLLIIGPSGSGKSAMALKLIALGARLVADDRTIVENNKGKVIASCPATLSGLIEARGIGILPVQTVTASVEIRLVLDLNQTETQRMPPRRTTKIAEVDVETITRIEADHLPAALLCYLKGLNPAQSGV